MIMKLLLRKLTKIASCLTIVWLVGGGYPTLSFSAKTDRSLYIQNDRGEYADTVIDLEGKEVLLYEASHALVIGVSDYTNGWPSLPGVKKDVEGVKAALEAQGFKMVVRMDPDKSGLDQAFTEFISQYGQDPENRLLFYFAGHGHTVKTSYGEELGYIVPADAPNPHHDLAGFQSKAMEMQQIEIYAKRIQSKHALFLFDACFSGSLFALSRAVPEIIGYKTAQPVRQFITSGSADETVPDESVFRAQFARALQGEADNNGDGYVTGTELGEFLQSTVVNYSRNAQHPQYGKIRNPNLDKGDFVFLLPIDQEESTILQIDTPSETTFSLDDLTEIADKEKQVKAAWQAKLNEMENAFSEVNEYEKQDISKELKIRAWKRFVKAFSEENPYSTRDNELLDIAEERTEYWNNYTVVPTPTPIPEIVISTPTIAPESIIPTPTPIPEIVFRINGVVIRDADGKAIEPVNDIYTIPQNETVTITVDIKSSPDQKIEVAWTTGRGKVPPGNKSMNTYTAAKLGSDYVTVYVWDTVTGKELPELPINITVVPSDTLKPVFRIDEVVVKDANDEAMKPVDDIYFVKNGKTVTITVNVTSPKGHQVEFAWTTGRGKMPASNKKTNTYTAMKLGGDYVIVYVWDAVTGEELPELPINITVVP